MTRTFSQDDAVLNTASIITTRDRDYSDVNLLFQPRQGNGDLFRVTDAKSVLQSVRSLILTNSFERPFNSNIGANISDFLFDLNDTFTSIEINDAITRAIENHEPRAKIISIKIRGQRTQVINILLEFQIRATEEVVTLNLTIERIR